VSEQVDTQSTGAPLRVLFVEDNIDIAELSEQLLAEWGHQVMTAGNGADALAKLTAFSPDIVFIDIGLPGMNGYEVARRIRATLPPSVTLVALSGYGQEEHRKRADEVGFNRYLVKPVRDDQLAAVLSKCRPLDGR
jgi:two-component system CheB/CheR fusion protein